MLESVEPMTTDESLAEDAELIYQDLSDWKNQFFVEVREGKTNNQYIALQKEFLMSTLKHQKIANKIMNFTTKTSSSSPQ